MELLTSALARIQAEEDIDLIEPPLVYTSHEVAGLYIYKAEVSKISLLSPVSNSTAANDHSFVHGNDNVVICGHKSYLGNIRTLNICGSDNIVFIAPHVRVGTADIIIYGSGNIVAVGAFSSAGSVSVRIHGDGARRIIGDGSMLSNRIVLGGPACRLVGAQAGGVTEGDIAIGPSVWIGREVAVRPGTVIGRDSMIGQMSVVQGSFAPASVLAGHPARVLASDIAWSRWMANDLEEARTSRLRLMLRLKPEQALRDRIQQLADDEAVALANTHPN